MPDIDRRRLNEALAMHLFELKLLPHGVFAPRLRHDTGIRVLPDPYSGLCEPLIEDVPDYLTWAGLGLVIGAMRARDFHYVLRDHMGSQEALFQRDDQNCAAVARAEFLPEAVALAALRAVAPEVAAELEKGE